MQSAVVFAAMMALLTLMQGSCVASRKTHVLYWNSIMSPELKRDDHVLNVKIGEFMDILCPQRSLMGMLGSSNEPEKFDLFNVTQDEYDQCKMNGQGNFLFACNRPERENKLTLKFQTISPSPFGFRFQYCADYYFIALPRGRHLRHGCSKQSTKIHIKIGCQEKEDSHQVTTTTSTTAATTAASTTISPKSIREIQSVEELLNRIKQHRNNKKEENPSTIFVPEIVSPLDMEASIEENHPRVLQVISRADLSEGGDSSASSTINSRRNIAFALVASIFVKMLVV